MTSIASAFESPRALIQRARELIEDAAFKIKAFFDGRPYTRLVETDPFTGQDVHKVRLTATLPGNIRPIIKDAAGNLRDALDHAVYACAVYLVGGEPDNTGFPFAGDAKGVEGELGSDRLRGNPLEIRPCLASFQPYPAGNGLICGLNRIRNPNTHRVLVPVGSVAAVPQSYVKFALWGGGLGGGGGGGFRPGGRWDAIKNEIELVRVGRGTQINIEVTVAFSVSFGDVKILAGREVIGTLLAIASEVERIVAAIEAETLRLKPG